MLAVALVGCNLLLVGCKESHEQRWRPTSCERLLSDAPNQPPAICLRSLTIVGPERLDVCEGRIRLVGKAAHAAVARVEAEATARALEADFQPEDNLIGFGPSYDFPARICGTWKRRRWDEIQTDEGIVDVLGPVRILTEHPRKAQATIRRVMEMLIARDYAGLKRVSGDAASIEEVRSSLATWGKRLRMPSDDYLMYSRFHFGQRSEPLQWHQEYPLWTVEEGRTESSLFVTLIDSPGELYGFRHDRVHIAE